MTEHIDGLGSELHEGNVRISSPNRHLAESSVYSTAAGPSEQGQGTEAESKTNTMQSSSAAVTATTTASSPPGTISRKEIVQKR